MLALDAGKWLTYCSPDLRWNIPQNLVNRGLDWSQSQSEYSCKESLVGLEYQSSNPHLVSLWTSQLCSEWQICLHYTNLSHALTNVQISESLKKFLVLGSTKNLPEMLNIMQFYYNTNLPTQLHWHYIYLWSPTSTVY
jgi:hypothetical protein